MKLTRRMIKTLNIDGWDPKFSVIDLKLKKEYWFEINESSSTSSYFSSMIKGFYKLTKLEQMILIKKGIFRYE